MDKKHSKTPSLWTNADDGLPCEIGDYLVCSYRRTTEANGDTETVRYLHVVKVFADKSIHNSIVFDISKLRKDVVYWMPIAIPLPDFLETYP